MSIVRLVALQPIQHDGKPIAPGERFDVPDGAAAALLACGAAVPGDDAVQTPAPPPEPEPARRRARGAAG